mmetsp:Transcript_27839/g.69788  ORF Transcript_27839/g.69788 Transcript_27839/m.69788 type:complete len:426 (+) Transcript_27839:122-1399(+)
MRLGDGMDGFGKMVHIGWGDARNADAAVLGHVHVVVRAQRIHLIGCQAGVAKHADLVGDVFPVACGPERLQLVHERLAHVDDAARHGLHVARPLRPEFGVTQDGFHQARAVDGRVGVRRPDHNLQLAQHTRRLVLVSGHYVGRPAAMAVQPKVLRERLCHHHLQALLNEEAHGEGIGRKIARCKPLICRVEKGEVLLLLEDFANFPPLVGAGVHAGGVVGTAVQEHDGALREGLQVGNVVVKVQAARGGVVVAQELDVEPGVVHDRNVVGPRGLGHVHLGVGKVALEELRQDAQRTSAGDGLRGHHPFVLDGRRVLAKQKVGGQGAKLGGPCDGGVFVVHAVDFPLSHLDRRQDPWFAVLVAVSSNAKVDFHIRLVFLECLSDAKDGIRRPLLHMGKPGCGCLLHWGLECALIGGGRKGTERAHA